MFASDVQLAEVCLLLTERLGKGAFWEYRWNADKTKIVSADLNPLGVKIARKMPGYSHGEILVIRFALNLWNDSWKSPAISDLIHILDSGHLRRIATLMIAISEGGHAVDKWIATNQPPTAPMALADSLDEDLL